MELLNLLQIELTGQIIGIGIAGLTLVSGFGYFVHTNLNSRISKKADKGATVREFDNIYAKIKLKADRELTNKMAYQINQIHGKLMNGK